MSTEDSEVACHFDSGPQSARAARRLVSDTLRAWDRTDLDEIATLLVSELIANVVLHAGTDLQLHLRRVGDRVRIEVHDASPRLPDRKFYSATSTTGRGLMLVEKLSRAWGAQPATGGKAVWFELDGTAAATPTPIMDARFDDEDWGELADDLSPARPPQSGRGRGSVRSGPAPGSESRSRLRSPALHGGRAR